MELGFTHDEAFQEAKRCLQCQLNIFVDGDNCILCNACVEVCPVNVIHMADLELIESDQRPPFEPRLMEAKGWKAGAAMIMDENLCIRCGLCAPDLPDELHHHAALRAASGGRAQRGRGGRAGVAGRGPAGRRGRAGLARPAPEASTRPLDSRGAASFCARRGAAGAGWIPVRAGRAALAAPPGLMVY